MYCLALDVGDRRTGIALGERLARPLTTLKRRSKVEDFGAIGRLVREHHVDTVVVGLPLDMDGSKGFQAAKVERYALHLRDALAEILKLNQLEESDVVYGGQIIYLPRGSLLPLLPSPCCIC